MTTKYLEAVYKEGRIELLNPISLEEGTRVKVLIEEDDEHGKERVARQVAYIKQLRGAFKGSLSTSKEFSGRKVGEKARER